jgi:hypothetical protein
MAGPQGQLQRGPFSVVAVPVESDGFVFSWSDAAEFLRGLGHTGIALGMHDFLEPWTKVNIRLEASVSHHLL